MAQVSVIVYMWLVVDINAQVAIIPNLGSSQQVRK